jgi:hypothetical protein
LQAAIEPEKVKNLDHVPTYFSTVEDEDEDDDNDNPFGNVIDDEDDSDATQ